MKFKILLATLGTALAGCSSVPLEAKDAPASPRFDFKSFYNGKVEVQGIVQDRKGRLTHRFHEVLVAHWNGADGTMEDTMWYDDGKVESRTWHIRQASDDHYTFRAQGIVGTGNIYQSGGAVRMAYTYRLETGGKTYDLAMDDRSWLMPDGALINKIEMSKFGVTVGHLAAVIRKVN